MPRVKSPSLSAVATYGRRLSRTAPGRSFDSQTTIGPLQSAVLGLVASTKSGRMTLVDIRTFTERDDKAGCAQMIALCRALHARGLVVYRVPKRGGGRTFNAADYSSITITAAGRALLGREESGTVLTGAPPRR